MDGDRFDRFARSWAGKQTRRQVLWTAVKGALLAVAADSLPRRAAAGSDECGFRVVTFWLNAFIPRNVFNEDGSLWTITLDEGPYRGDTAIPAPPLLPLGQCFHTDQRSFDSDRPIWSAAGDILIWPGPTSRMHSQITVDLLAGTIVGPEGGNHRCSETLEINCSDGEVLCSETATNPGRFFGLTVSPDKRSFDMALEAAASNPCVTGAPNIDYSGIFRVELDESGHRAIVSFDGLVNRFPAYEAYAAFDGGEPQFVFRRLPEPGLGPFIGLIGDPNAAVQGSAFFVVDDAFACAGVSVCCAGQCCGDDRPNCCDGECVDLVTDLANCGACTRACTDGKVCENRECVCPQLSCLGVQEVDPNTCQCACPDPCPDPEVQVQDPETCECACAEDPCTAPQTQDPDTCECVCPAGGSPCGTSDCCDDGGGCCDDGACCPAASPVCCPAFCCPADSPVCCANDCCEPGGGCCDDGLCCPPDFPVCCADGGCCPAGTTCVPGGCR